ncbi:DsbA family protein [Paenibacillus tritici]|uniref:DsbA family protein n=1 Tax=Paenibacillus tritici TaxID=1873425 RepID=A0ABX2DT08_9BACL|nr:DsbA family protein [Paenibacillus tritici]NQX47545.1 DsbA family protein [Paenibacillus tritici]
MNTNPMICDLKTGVCGVGEEDEHTQMIDFNPQQPAITLYYATDPICSHCWAIEPTLNRFIRQYGQYFKVQLLMGGLLAGWNGFADRANGIQQPADVAGHWKEVGEHYRMPIDGTLWLSNPVQSSYPPSRVFKVIQSSHPGNEHAFLRRAREAVFVFNRNIGEEQVLIDIVNGLGLPGDDIVQASALEAAQDLLEEDFQRVAQLGVRGFPTLVMVNEENKGVKLVGSRTLQNYVDALQQLTTTPLIPAAVPALPELMAEGHLLFAREIEVMYDIEQQEVEDFTAAALPAQTYHTKHILNELYIEPA